MKVFRLLIISIIFTGIASCTKESMRISSGKSIINGENYTYETTLLSQIMGAYPYEGRLYKENDKFIFRTSQMGFSPINKKSDSPNFIIEFAIFDMQDLRVGKKYYIGDNEKDGEDYITDCYFHRYWWDNGVSYDELRRYAIGFVELTSIDKENGWVAGQFEFEVPATDEYERWSAKGNFKLNTEVK